jgi:hypothetical protein
VQAFSATASNLCLDLALHQPSQWRLWMTRKIMNVMLTGTTLALLSAAPGLAQGLPPGLGSFNGLAANILSTKATSTNFAGLGRVVAVELPRR